MGFADRARERDGYSFGGEGGLFARCFFMFTRYRRRKQTRVRGSDGRTKNKKEGKNPKDERNNVDASRNGT